LRKMNIHARASGESFSCNGQFKAEQKQGDENRVSK
jgi:hypothetical protein